MDGEPAIIMADSGGVIRIWNEGAEKLLGHRAIDAIGHKLDLIVPERYRSAHWSGFGGAMRRGTVKNEDLHGNLPLIRADGSEVHYPGRLVFLRDAFGNAVGAMGIFTANEDVETNGLMTVP